MRELLALVKAKIEPELAFLHRVNGLRVLELLVRSAYVKIFDIWAPTELAPAAQDHCVTLLGVRGGRRLRIQVVADCSGIAFAQLAAVLDR